MKSKKPQPTPLWYGKVASGLILGSTFWMGTVIVPQSSYAALQEGIPAAEIAPDRQIAQAITTLLNYDTAGYSVRVFTEGGITKMNVFDRGENLLRVNGLPASFTIRQGVGAYVTSGDFSGRQARYIAEVFPDEFARLVIIDGSNQTIVSQDATNISVFNVPRDQLDSIRQNTLLRFDTNTYSVRVFERDNLTFMNVFNRFTGATEVNGQPASLQPDANLVRYVSSGTRNNQTVEYIAELDGGGRTAIILENVNGQQLFRESGSGEVTINPQPNWPIDVTNGTAQVNDAYVAAVFGGQDTLEEVQRIFPDAFIDNSARQGRFINAGSFPSRDEATLRVLELRSRGFGNARVVFRDVRFR